MNLLLVSHGHLASGIITSFEMIAGEQKKIDFIELDDTGVENFRKKLKKYLKNKSDVLILADMAGGTPYNESFKYFLSNSKNIQLVSGLNLPMLLEIGTQTEQKTNIFKLAETAKNIGLNSIEIASDQNDSSDDIEF